MSSKASSQLTVVQCGKAEWRVKVIEELGQNTSRSDEEEVAKRAVCARGGLVVVPSYSI